MVDLIQGMSNLGSALRNDAGKAVTRDLLMKQAQSRITYMSQIQKQLLENGYGFDYDTVTGEWTDPDYANTNQEVMLGRYKYLEKNREAARKVLEDKNKLANIANNVFQRSKAIMDDTNINNDTKINLLKNLEAVNKNILGDLWDEMGIDIVSQYQSGVEINKIQENIKLNSIAATQQAYMKSRDLNDWAKYAAVYNQDPKFFKGMGYSDPMTMEKQWTSERTKELQIDYEKRKKAVTGSKGIVATLPDGTKIEIGGNQELTPSTTTEVQKDILGLMQQLEDVNVLENTAFLDTFTYQGKIKGGLLNMLSKAKVDIGDENKEYIGKVRQTKEAIEQIFNAYRKEITGAQAAIKEIRMLRDSILNKDLSPDELVYSINRYKSQIKRQLRLKRMFLAQGLNNKLLNEALDKASLTGKDIPTSEIDRYGDELKSQGFSDAEVVQRLRLEGYLGK